MEAKSFRLNVVLALHSEGALRAISGTSRYSPIETTLLRMLTHTTRLPEECGYRLERETSVARQEDGTYQLSLHATVFNAERLLLEARKEHRRRWLREISETDLNIFEQLYQVVVASNASPAPRDCGYELLRWQSVEV